MTGWHLAIIFGALIGISLFMALWLAFG